MINEECKDNVQMYEGSAKQITKYDKPIIATSISDNGVQIRFANVEQASQMIIGRGSEYSKAERIKMCLDGELNQCLGFRWRFVEDRSQRTRYNSEAVICFGNGEYNEIAFPSMKRAEEITGVHCTNICDCCSGKRKSAGGYRWMRLSDYIDRSEIYLHRDIDLYEE